MKAKGKFKFKEIRKTEAGTFKDKETGKDINYNSSYKLVVDEIDADGIHERIYKLKEDSPLVPQLQKLKAYSDIEIIFDVKNYASGTTSLLPVGIVAPELSK